MLGPSLGSCESNRSRSAVDGSTPCSHPPRGRAGPAAAPPPSSKEGRRREGGVMTTEMDLESLEVLTTDDCLMLLARAAIGRVGFVVAGRPIVLPVNYLADPDGTIVFRTHDRSILTAVARHSATFEVDGYDEAHRLGWSVCVHGEGREITDSD